MASLGEDDDDRDLAGKLPCNSIDDGRSSLMIGDV